MHYILMSRSLTNAQKAARRLQNAGIFAVVAKAPQSANPGGCTYGVKIGLHNLSGALSRLQADGISVAKVLRVTDNGEVAEVTV
ncbi:MAG: DUF3343 domain-containing protein [Ruminococcaceae bacterium]|nr:DUF3343 domain-containing protein [Oscillospiraceae bacterium]